MFLTKRQKEVLEFVARFIAENHYSPSFEEIASSLQLASIATVHKHLKELEGKGYLVRHFNRSRAMEIAPKYYEELQRNQQRFQTFHKRDDFAAPLVGSIAAGQPIETYEQQERLSFGPLIGSSDVFALRVRGESMVEDHILDGDYVLVEKARRARDGEIVVALVDGTETTLKRYFREGENVRLQPANVEMEPIVVPAKQVQIQGRLLAVHRRYN